MSQPQPPWQCFAQPSWLPGYPGLPALDWNLIGQQDVGTRNWAGKQTGIFPKAGSSATTSVFDVSQVVRQEILQVLKELKTLQPPPEPKKLNREELLEALKALGI